MTPNIATTKEQSARLLQCGVSDESADMCYQFIDECFNNTDNPICSTPKEQYATISGCGFGDHRIHITPAWSLSALLSLLPKKIMNGVSRIYTVEIAYSHTFNDAPWTINYEGNGLNKNAHFNGKSPIEACVKAIEWLTANNYKLNQL